MKLGDIIKKRNKKIDFLKGIVIIIMIIGHAIQYGGGENNLNQQLFFNNYLFKFIYGFHMPIFMLISGYLFYYSTKGKKCKDVVIIKLKQLLIPLVVWSTLIFFINNNFKFTLGFTSNIIEYFNYLFNYLWYLWAFLLSSIIVLLIEKSIKFPSIYLLIIGLFFITPDILMILNGINHSLIISLSCFKFTFIFFVIGYYSHKWEQIKKLINLNNGFSLIILLIFYLLMIYFWKKDFYIYTSGFSLINKNLLIQFGIDCYRLVAALIGCATCICTVNFLSNYIKETNIIYRIITYVGTKTLGIYVISCSLFYSVIVPLTKNIKFNYIFILFESIAMLLVCLIINYVLEHYKFTKKIFLGGR